MTHSFIIAVLTSLSVALILIAILNPLVSRYFQIRSDVKLDSELLLSFAGPVIVLFSEIFSGSHWDSRNDTLTRKLLLAGQPGGLSEGKYLFSAVVLAAGFFFIFNFICMYIIGGFSQTAITFSLILATIVYVFGIRWVDGKVATRKISISREFPYFLDQAVMSMSSGATFPSAIESYVRENSSEPLSEELSIVLSEMKYGKTMIEALGDLDGRITSPGVNNALKAIMQGERMGTSIGESLSDQADTIRFSRSQDAEKLAEEMKIRMQGPAMMLLLSVLVIVLGPAIVHIRQNSGVLF